MQNRIAPVRTCAILFPEFRQPFEIVGFDLPGSWNRNKISGMTMTYQDVSSETVVYFQRFYTVRTRSDRRTQTSPENFIVITRRETGNHVNMFSRLLWPNRVAKGPKTNGNTQLLHSAHTRRLLSSALRHFVNLTLKAACISHRRINIDLLSTTTPPCP